MRLTPFLSAAFVRVPVRPPHVTVRTFCSTQLSSVGGIIYSAPEERPTVQLYTKMGCTLCDKAKGVLTQAAELQPHTLEAVDITDAENVQWWKRYKYDIPVLRINGIYWAKHRCAPHR